jgi:hypothetical protein
LERAKAKLRYSIEVVKGLQTAEINAGKLCVFMQRLRQFAPLNGQRIHRRLTTFSGLLPELDRKVKNGRNSDEHSSHLANGGEHFPVHQICFAFGLKQTVFRSGN